MSIFDVLTNGGLGAVLNSIAGQGGKGPMGGLGGSVGSVLNDLGRKAKSAADTLGNATPGGLGGLAGAGALGAILGNVIQGDLLKSVAMAGAGAVAYNFYKKWAADQQGNKTQAAMNQERPATEPGWGDTVPASIDPTAELVIRSMIYAARADGNIDSDEQARIDAVLQNMMPGQDVSGVIQRIRSEAIDPNKIAVAVGSPEQAEDVYRLSCAVIDIDHFMEHSYTQALAQALGLSQAKKQDLEREADTARRALMASVRS